MAKGVMLKVGAGIPRDLTATSNRVLYGKTFIGANGEQHAGSVPSVQAQTIVPTTIDQTIESGLYLAGTITVAGEPNLIPGNIRSGVTIFGVIGTY